MGRGAGGPHGAWCLVVGALLAAEAACSGRRKGAVRSGVAAHWARAGARATHSRALADEQRGDGPVSVFVLGPRAVPWSAAGAWQQQSGRHAACCPCSCKHAQLPGRPASGGDARASCTLALCRPWTALTMGMVPRCLRRFGVTIGAGSGSGTYPAPLPAREYSRPHQASGAAPPPAPAARCSLPRHAHAHAPLVWPNTV